MTKNEHRPTSRVLDILELLAFSSGGYTLTEIASAINAPKSSIFPVIHTLLQRKFITIDKQTSKYTIGINTFAVGSSYLENLNVLNFITEEMQLIVDKCLETCQLGVLDKDKVLYIAKVDSPEPIRLISSVGKKLPAYCTALGKALLCDCSLSELLALYPNGLEPYTENTITDFNVLYGQLCDIKKTNIAMDIQEVTDQIQCISVPIRKDKQVVLALGVSIPAYRATSEKFELLERLLLQSKTKIEVLLDRLNIDVSTLNFFS
ncbi:IclR family transcriptional regulator [Clostridium thermopalmarium]|uniref:Transcriptional regulator KdgR n=1 Tax=Clostridium thermopalmarium DSM 5974 TaxID=1121340 RepID=A0A2T0ANW3_9CLOT|nr:IclR family transcriptional regulator [Clostridium thermopalmarium]PRR70589.1 Transcriptional regulator KdgR [Clostridium thermopalmarium DSM 5974]PVZ21681.1 IclR family transcriptional regulator [Clostridium thermopalmarium DSM 5974]